MKRRLRFEEDARHEFWQSIDWYNEKETDLGWAFANELMQELAKIADDPFRFRIVRRRDQIRKASAVTRFEFNVYFSVTEHEMLVVSVFHPNRNPAELRRRGITGNL
jgi:hypothetical protein